MFGWILDMFFYYFLDGFWRLKGDQQFNKTWIKHGVEKRVVLGGGNPEKLVDMGVQGALNIKDYIYIKLYLIILLY